MKQKLVILLLAILFSFTCFSQRPQYSGKKHSASHGGIYRGGHGSSHKGGHYVNSRTHNRYGRHKK